MSVPNAPIIAYRNLLREGTLAGGGTPAHAVDWRLDRSWQPSVTSAMLECTLPTAQPAESLAIAGHNLAGGTVTLRAWTGSAFVDTVTIEPTDASCVLTTFPAVNASRWQIDIQGTQPIALAVLFVGPVLALESGLRQGFVPPLFSQQAEILDTTSQEGVPLGRSIRRQPGKTTINVTDLDDGWMRSHWLPFRDHSLRYPFFLQWNPEGYPNEAALCWADGAPAANAYTRPGFMDGTLACRCLTEVPV